MSRKVSSPGFPQTGGLFTAYVMYNNICKCPAQPARSVEKWLYSHANSYAALPVFHPRRPRGNQSGREKWRDENFRHAFSPGPTDCPWPWVFEDASVPDLQWDSFLSPGMNSPLHISQNAPNSPPPPKILH